MKKPSLKSLMIMKKKIANGSLQGRQKGDEDLSHGYGDHLEKNVRYEL